jgi:hypothetical protein
MPRCFRYIFSWRERPLFPSIIRLSAQETARLLKDIESPPPPNEELKKAFTLYKETIGRNP